MTPSASDDTAPGCACPGRGEGRHGLLCEHVLRGAFGTVGNAPEDVKQLMRERGRLVPGTVVAGETGATPAGDAPLARCAYCDAEFEPRAEGQRYCKPSHQAKAKRKRRHGLAAEQAPELEVTCPWCREPFTTRDPGQSCCCGNHRLQYRRCRRKESFYTAEAAGAMARLRAAPARGGELSFYRCPGPGRAHWHLRDVEKARVKKAASRAAAGR